MTMPINLRRATDRDLVHIIELLHEDDLGAARETLEYPLPQSYRDVFNRIQNDSNSILMVANLDERIVGTMQITFVDYLTFQGSRAAIVESVRVTTALRGRKIGETMITWAIDEARRQRCHRIQLTTDKRRNDAHRFYERLGFKATHEGMKMFL